MQATNTLFALICNDPTHPAVADLCTAILEIQGTAFSAPKGLEARVIAANWDVLGPRLLLALLAIEGMGPCLLNMKTNTCRPPRARARKAKARS